MGRRELLRIESEVEVHFKTFNQFHQEYTRNISKGGIFIKTQNPLPPQTAIEIKLFLPDEPEPIEGVGEVVHIIPPELAEERGWDAGMGVQFVDFEETMQKKLERYIYSRIKENPRLIQDRRKHPRAKIRMKVRFPDLTTLLENFAKDISQGGIFIPTNNPKPVGTVMNLTLIHPDTKEEIEVKGEVVRVVTEKEVFENKEQNLTPGMGIKFIDLTPEQELALERFLAVEYPINLEEK